MSLLAEDSFVKLAANIATLLFAVFIVIQLLLAAGILPISIAWGGRQSELTLALRVVSIVAAFVLCAFIYIIRYRAGLLGGTPIPTPIRVMSWVVTAFMALNTLGNFASTSNVERFLFGPMALILTIACLIVSASNID